MCFGVYAPGGAQAGFARVVTDGATFAWLCDVYIARGQPRPRHRDLAGPGRARPPADLGVPRILLATLDAHGVYAKAGFAPLAEPDRWMEID